MASGKGSRITDVDGNTYIDYVLSWGPLILGHCHPEVVEALERVLRTGTSFGATTAAEVELAERICEAFPSVERVRLTSSGTEATMAALRLARAATNREKILKFEGCYHGHGDSLLVRAGSGVATLGLPDSPGVPRALAELTITVPFNDLGALEEAFRAHRHQFAAAIAEPVVGNAGCIPPNAGFLERLRELTAEQGTVLIFDEVMTGFRIAYGGAQELFGMRADLTTLGKVIGGGLPVGAYGGRADLMERVAPAGPVYQAGTLSGNPLAVTAGVKTLEILRRPGSYDQLETMTAALAQGLKAAAHRAGVPLTVNRVGSMFTAFFTADPVSDFTSAKRADAEAYGRFFRGLLDRGVSLPPSQFEAGFLSLAHTSRDVQQTIAAAEEALRTG
jgi:glutamate-1-semialdehyde 2,1-aminomutase